MSPSRTIYVFFFCKNEITQHILLHLAFIHLLCSGYFSLSKYINIIFFLLKLKYIFCLCSSVIMYLKSSADRYLDIFSVFLVQIILQRKSLYMSLCPCVTVFVDYSHRIAEQEYYCFSFDWYCQIVFMTYRA